MTRREERAAVRTYRSASGRSRAIWSFLFATLLTTTAFAESGRGQDVIVPARDAGAEEPRPWSIGARAFGQFFGEAILGGGVDVGCSVIPNVAVGVQYTGFVADQGADPHYCVRCVFSGASALAYGEARYLPDLWLTPYSRFGAGLTYLKGQDGDSKPHQESNLGLLAEVGLEFHPGWLSVRAFVFQQFALASEFDERTFRGIGLQLGGRL